jgi:hypothetical protein
VDFRDTLQIFGQRMDAWLGVTLYVTKCSFQGGVCIIRSIALILLHFLLLFELVVVNNLTPKGMRQPKVQNGLFCFLGRLP